MKYRPFGRTGVKVSELCLGCLNFGGNTDAETAHRLIDRAIDAGINFLDTANIYGTGRSEEVTGEALRRNGKRDQIFLATKVHGTMRDEPNGGGNSRRHIIGECEASLRRLRTDHIDLYQIHRFQNDIPIDETLRALDDLVRSGKVRYIGSSTFPAWRLMESLQVSKELGLNRFVSEQPPYNLLDRRIESELISFALTYGFALLPWSPLGGGLLSGNYSQQNLRPAGSVRFLGAEAYLDQILTREFLRRINRYTTLASAKGCTPSQLALAWVLGRPGVTSAIIGPRTELHLEDQLAVTGVTVTDADVAALDALFPPGRVISPFHDHDPAPSVYR